MTNPDDPVDTHEARTDFSIFKGLTKREYFAAMAIRGVIEWDAVMHESRPDYAGKVENIVKAAVGIADALIAELNK
jgi:hypothetical protein